MVARARQNPFRHSPERCAPFAMTSFWHESTGPDIKGVPANMALAPCGFARHASIARVCRPLRGRSGSPRASGTGLRHDLPPRVRLGVTSHLVRFASFSQILTSRFLHQGKNRRRSVPESSLTEAAAIPPAGNVLAARVPAGPASDINVTGIPGGTAGPSPTSGITIDTNMRAGGDPMYTVRPDACPFTELLVERDIPVSIHSGRGRYLPIGTRCKSRLAIPQDHASKLLSPEG